jgi:Fe-S-cluster-containing hydrogenase component 2
MVCSAKHGGVGNPSRAGSNVIKCDLRDGTRQCVRFCFPGALEFVEASAVNLRKNKEAATKLAELMSKVVAA